MKTAEEILLDYVNYNWGEYEKQLGVRLCINELPGKDIFEKITALGLGCREFEKNYGARLVDRYELPIYINPKYELIEFDLDLSDCEMDGNEKIVKKNETV